MLEPAEEPLDSNSTAGDFTTRYRKVAPAVYLWASVHLHKGLRSELDPEDLLQEVACRAFANRAKFDPSQGNFRAWVFGIARKVLYQALEKMIAGTGGATRDWLTTGGLMKVPDEATSVTRHVAKEEQEAQLMDVVTDLPEEDRKLLLYRGLEGLEHAEIARLMDIEPATAAKRWARLRSRLQEGAKMIPFLSE